jgi:tetratricopeptide (TPR) repeat protein
MTMGVHIQRQHHDRWVNRSVIVLLITIIGIQLSTYLSPSTDSARAEARVAGTIDAWLKDLKAGGDGLSFWAPNDSVEPIQFHSVRFWQTIAIDPFSHALVRVDSQTDEGEPISKLWKICFGTDRDGARPITRVVDAADESAPPAHMARQSESKVARNARREKEETRQDKEQSRRDKEEAAGRLEALSRKLRVLEVQTELKLTGVRESLDQQAKQTDRQMLEQVEWLEQLVQRMDKTYRELIAANAPADTMRNADRRRVLAESAPAVPAQARSRGPQGPASMPPAGIYQDFFSRAENFYRAGSYRDAVAVYSSLIDAHPEVQAAYLRRGDCYCSLHDYDLALADFATAIQLLPKDARAHLARSWAHLGKGAAESAMSDAAEALRLDPTLAEAHLIRTEVFARKGQPDQARAERSEALTAFYRRGVASIIKHDYEPAIADLERVIREAPDRAEAHAWCGKAYYLRLDFPRAVQEFSKVIALQPEGKQSYNDRGMARFRTGSYDAAMSDFDRAIQLDPKFELAYLNRGTARLATGEIERAASDFSIVIQLDPRNAMAYRLRSMADERMGRTGEATNDLKIAESLSH